MIREVEVPVEVVREVEVPVEVIREVEVVREVPVISPISYLLSALGIVLVVVSGVLYGRRNRN